MSTWNLPPGVTTNDPHINPPAPRMARPVVGYLRVYRRWQHAQTRLDTKLNALDPLRRKVAELRDVVRLREGRLTGGQLAAVRRILAPRQTDGGAP